VTTTRVEPTGDAHVPPRGHEFSSPRHRIYRITPRQHEVLFWLSFGLTVRAIGGKLSVSENTARTLMRGLYRNLDVGTSAEAIRVGFETGLLSPRVERVGAVVARPSTSPGNHGYADVRGQPTPEDLGVPGTERA
jgi:DNA-binding CsgD family transcriptional regulator